MGLQMLFQPRLEQSMIGQVRVPESPGASQDIYREEVENE
jgi:hypothetical protein